MLWFGDDFRRRTGEPGGAVKSYWQGRKVLVTGAGGFIGSHLTERLVREGARVRALLHYNSRGDWGNLELCPEKIRKEIDVVSGDLADPGGVRAAAADRHTAFHLARLR